MSFHLLLHNAITLGQVPNTEAGLGPTTLATIRLVVREHPDATVELILGAHDAFRREHG